MKKQITIHLLLFLTVSTSFGDILQKMEDQKKTIVEDAKSISYVLHRFDFLFPDSYYTVSYMHGKGGDPKVNGFALIGGRYIINIIVPVDLLNLKESDNPLKSVGRGSVQIREIVKVEKVKGKVKSVNYGRVINLSFEETTRLLEDENPIETMKLDLTKDKLLTEDSDFFRF